MFGSGFWGGWRRGLGRGVRREAVVEDGPDFECVEDVMEGLG